MSLLLNYVPQCIRGKILPFLKIVLIFFLNFKINGETHLCWSARVLKNILYATSWNESQIFFGNNLITTVPLLLLLLQTYASSGENLPLFCTVWMLKLQFLWWGTSFPLWHHWCTFCQDILSIKPVQRGRLKTSILPNYS